MKICRTGPAGSILKANLRSACLPQWPTLAAWFRICKDGEVEDNSSSSSKVAGTQSDQNWGLSTQQQNFMYKCTIEGFYQLTWHKTHRLVDSVELWKVCLCVRECGWSWPGVRIWQLTTRQYHLPLKNIWPRCPREWLGGHRFRTC